MEKDIIEGLESFGLLEKEIKVYVSLLELGESSVNKITERSELNRVTVYPVLKSLIEKGFVSKFHTEGKSHFKAISPKQILDLIKEKELRIKSILPLLEDKTRKIVYTTSVELFRGSKGLYSFIDKLYSGEDKEFYAYGNFDVAKRVAEYQALHGRKLRIEKRIYLKSIVSPLTEDYFKDVKYRKVTELRINPQLKGINIYIIFSKKRTGIIEVTKEISGIIIENEEIAKYHKFVYDLLLKGSKKI